MEISVYQIHLLQSFCRYLAKSGRPLRANTTVWKKITYFFACDPLEKGYWKVRSSHSRAPLCRRCGFFASLHGRNKACLTSGSSQQDRWLLSQLTSILCWGGKFVLRWRLYLHKDKVLCILCTPVPAEGWPIRGCPSRSLGRVSIFSQLGACHY